MNEDTEIESRRFSGDRVGPHLLITAGVHGDEFAPMLAVRKLIRRFESDHELLGELRGTVTMIPVVNRSAYLRGHRTGEDGLDLARTFPGRKDGSVTQRVAHAVAQQIKDADFYIDLHTGGTQLCVLPLAGYVLHCDQTILEQQREMASAFRLPLVWGTSDDLPGRSLSIARDAGVPAIYVEHLGAHRELSEIAAGKIDANDPEHPLVAGCLRVMRHLEMLELRNEEDLPQSLDFSQEIIEDRRSGSGHMQICNPAPACGFLTLKVQLGQYVSRGSLLAEIESIRGNVIHSVRSQQEGKVVVVRDFPRIKQGDSVAVIAEQCEAS